MKSPSPTLQRRQLAGIELISCQPGKPLAAAPPIILVHGAFAGAWIWAEKFMPRLAAAGYASHALSLRGHGDSSGKDRIDQHSIRDYCDDLQAVVTELGAPPVLAGHSMGGFVVQKYLERFTARAAILMSSVPPQGLIAATFHLFMKRPGLLLELNRLLSSHDISLDAARSALFAGHVDDALLTRYLQRMSPESQRAIWDMSVFNLVNIPAVRRTPLMVLGAEHDQLIPAFLVATTAHSYGVPSRIFNGFGHGFLLEDGSEEIADAMTGWLGEVLA